MQSSMALNTGNMWLQPVTHTPVPTGPVYTTEDGTGVYTTEDGTEAYEPEA